MSLHFFSQTYSGRRGLRALFVLGALLIAGSAGATTCRVAVDGTSGGDGSNWGVQVMDLQTALGTITCDEVWVKAGVHTPTPDGDRTISFNIRPGVAVYGGFAGTENVRGGRNVAGNPTTLSGNIGDTALNTDNSYHVVHLDGTQGTRITASTVLDGFAIRDGNANGGIPQSYGGGLYCDGSGDTTHECSPSLANLSLSGNSAIHGGAIFNNGAFGNSSPGLTNVTFSGNSAITAGGAMYNYGESGSSSPTLVNVSFSGSSAVGFGGGGGAMVNDGHSGGSSSPSLTNVTFSGNSATQGGAIYNWGSGGGTSRPALNNVILWGDTLSNLTTVSEIYNDSATPVLNDSVVQGGCPTGSTCSNVIDADPLLGPLQDNGGGTHTMLPGAGSSAIDNGDASTCAATDQRGIARPQGAACDIGAVEVEIDRSTAGACRVDTSKPAPGDGLSWITAYQDLQSALRDRSCSEVWVATGLYTPVTPATSGAPTPAERGISFDVRATVEVYGSFAGDELQRSDRILSVANASILSGDLNNDDGADFANNSENSDNVVTMDGTRGTPVTATTVLDGFSIRGGNAGRGGGLYCDGHGAGHDCSPQLRNLSFSGNYAQYGGAVYNNGQAGISSPSLTNVTFSGNKARDGGGAIFNWGQGGTSSPSLVNVTFHANSAAAYGGGAMLNWGADGTSSPILTNVTFSGNSASSGAAMVNFYYGVDFGNTHPILNNVILWDNHSDVGDASGIGGADMAVLNNSVVQGGCPTGSTCSNVIDTDPLLGPLQDNGGSAQTMLPGAGSSAIDAGNDATCAASPVNGLDQRGVSRPQGAHCDIGAVEVAQYVLTASVIGNGSISAAASPVPVIGSIATCTTAGGSNCAAGYAPGDSVSLTASADVGQHLVAWSGDCSGSAVSTSVTMDADKTCSATFVINTHSIGGTVNGLAGSGLVLRLNGGDDLPISTNGVFTFSGALDYGSPYTVSVFSQPGTPAQTCTLSNASGTLADADVTDVVVDCTTNTHTVTGTVGNGQGAITPLTQSVADGSTALLTVTADPNWHIDTVSGCGGALSGTSYTTAAITGDCMVTANFAIDTFTVTASVSGGNGTISPTSITPSYGDTPVFSLSPDPGYLVASVSGCGGTLSGNTYTTAPITGPCVVSASFAQVVAPYTPIPTLDIRMLLLLAGLLGGLAALRLRRG